VEPFVLPGLQDKVAIVTGAGQGIGRACALALAQGGCHVACAEIVDSTCNETADAVLGLGRRAAALPTDVTKIQEIQRMVRETESQLGPVDILANVVGGPAGYDYTWAVDVDGRQWQAIMDLSLKATFFCSTTVAKAMMRRGSGGSIIHIGSMAGIHASVRSLAYGAAKAGVMHLAKSMAVEWGRHGIRVNSVAPGTIVTARIGARRTPEEQAKRIALLSGSPPTSPVSSPARPSLSMAGSPRTARNRTPECRLTSRQKWPLARAATEQVRDLVSCRAAWRKR
jgi:NAD(P)-dependent dehydrogenase (short-subunit alcohol dehydrogenase family)